jgi:hypothetical protein
MGVLPPPKEEMPVKLFVEGANGETADAAMLRSPAGTSYVAVFAGYDKAPTSPRLVAMWGNQRIMEQPIQDLPAPKTALAPGFAKPGRVKAEVTRSARGGNPFLNDHAIRITLDQPVPKGKAAQVGIVRTAFSDFSEIEHTEIVREGQRSVDVVFPNSSDAERVEVRVRYLDVERKTDRVKLPVGELKVVLGQPTFRNASRVKVTTPSGFDLTAEAQHIYPRRKPKRIKPEIEAFIQATNTKSANGFGRTQFGYREAAAVKLVGPKPETYGLKALQVGTTRVDASGTPAPAFKEGPLTFELEVTGEIAKPVQSFTEVVPVK